MFVTNFYSSILEMRVSKVFESVWMQQKMLIDEITRTVYTSGNLNGIPQWRDRKKLYTLTEKFGEGNYLLSRKDFQFLESLHYKYKV